MVALESWVLIPILIPQSNARVRNSRRQWWSGFAARSTALCDVPDILSIDLIFMPDFMKAGFMTDITDKMKGDPNIGRVRRLQYIHRCSDDVGNRRARCSDLGR